MKTSNQRLAVITACLVTWAGALAQPNIPGFTQITTGPLVQDSSGGISATWVDVDGDGWLDVYITLASFPGTSTYFNRLLRNNRDGTFTPITNAYVATAGIMTAWADFNNDGAPDLFIPKSGSNFLLQNLGNFQFNRITGAFVGDGVAPYDCLWFDYDRDGWVDLFVMEGSPTAPGADRLYRNLNGTNLLKMTAAKVGSLLANVSGGWNCFALDINNDNWPDVYRNIEGSTGPFHQIDTNNGQGFFFPMDVGPMTNGVAAASTITWGDYDNDGFPDAFVFNYQAEAQFYRNLQGQGFTNVLAGSGLPTESGGFGAAWGDFDNDGWLDALMINAVGQPGFIYRNNGDGTFTKTSISFPANPNPNYGASFAYWGDYDNDGFLDLLFANAPQTPLWLYHNDGNSNRWLKVKLNGTASNRMGIGAKVRVRATINGRTFWQHREILSAQTYNNTTQYGCLAHFGLGNATNIEVLRIEWPSGIVQEMANVTANQSLTITETVGIKMQPADFVVGVGAKVTNSVEAIGGVVPYVYQWYCNGTVIPGGIWPTLVLTNVQPGNAGAYYCVVRDDDSSYTTSRVASLTVELPKCQGVCLKAGKFEFNLTGNIGDRYELLRSAVVTPPPPSNNWTVIQTITLTNRTVVVSDLLPADDKNFYLIRRVP